MGVESVVNAQGLSKGIGARGQDSRFWRWW